MRECCTGQACLSPAAMILQFYGWIGRGYRTSEDGVDPRVRACAPPRLLYLKRLMCDTYRCWMSRLLTAASRSLLASDADFEVEMAYIKEKVDAGADFIITQMFFDTAVYVSYVKACRERYYNKAFLTWALARCLCCSYRVVVVGVLPLSHGGGFCLTRFLPFLIVCVSNLAPHVGIVAVCLQSWGRRLEVRFMSKRRETSTCFFPSGAFLSHK